MANKHSKKNQNRKVKDKTIEKLLAEEKPAKIKHEKKGLKVRFLETKGKVKEKRAGRVHLHKSFKRSDCPLLSTHGYHWKVGQSWANRKRRKVHRGKKEKE